MRPKLHCLVKFKFSGWLCVCLLALAYPLFSLLAQNHPSSSSRFLFIVDTSAPMAAHAPEILKVVGDILISGASGQIRSGDTIGLWTFDQDVHSDVPVQVWTARDQGVIAQRTTEFLRQQLAGKNPHANVSAPQKGGQFNKPAPSPSPFAKPVVLNTVLPDMFTVIKASDTITIFILSTGDGQMRGTPFDAEINSLYLQNIHDMQARRMPIVTILQARSGKILHYTLNALPWPIVMPPPLVEMSAPAPKNPPVTSAPISVPTQPAPAPTPVVSAPITLPVPAPAPLPESKPAAPVVVAPPPVVIAPPVEVPKTNSATVIESANVTPTPPPRENPATKVPASVEVAPSEVAVHKPMVQPPPVVQAPPPKEIISPPAPAPIAVAPAPSPHVVPPSGGSASPAPTKAVVQPTVSAPPAPVIQPEVATAPMEVAGRPRILLIAGIALVGIAVVLIILIIRRARDTSGPSLITRSMGNRKK